MASDTQVKQYLANWFQLGKKLIVNNQAELPSSLFEGKDYSRAFERCWTTVSCPKLSYRSYLEGTEISIGQLLDDDWDIHPCARCTMPIALPVAGVSPAQCPCHDLPSWPNMDFPKPRQPMIKQLEQAVVWERHSLESHRLDPYVEKSPVLHSANP